MRALALLAALLAAAVVPGAPAGIGVTLVGLIVAAAAASSARRSLDLLLFGGAAVLLMSFPSVLDARWIVVIDVLAAWFFATLAVGGVNVASTLAPVTALAALPTLVPESSARAVPALRAAAAGAIVALPFAVLFLTADAAFAAIADSAPMPALGSLPSRLAVFALVLLAALGLALAARQPARGGETFRRRPVAFVEWAVPLAVLNALFLAFVGVQVTVLFAGHDHVLRTTGLTYAEYARSGFWQLLAAAALTLVVVKAATLVAAPRSRLERLALRVLLAILCALTIVIVASAFHRLRLYESAYGLTRPRLAAEAFALWLGVTFGLVVAVGAAGRAAAVPRAVAAWTAVALIAFSAANPDARIADRNVERWRETGRIDVVYASTLSADATPELIRLPPPLARRALAPLTSDLAEAEPWSSANLSRRRARDLLAG